MKRLLVSLASLCAIQLMSQAASADTGYYRPSRYTCKQLNQVLDAQGHINLAIGLFGARSYAQPGAHGCSVSDSHQYLSARWVTRVVKASDGRCKLGVYCKRERRHNPGNND